MEKLYPLFEIAELIAKEKSCGLTASENEILQNWLLEGKNNKTIYKRFHQENWVLTEFDELKKFDVTKAYAKVELHLAPKTKEFKIPNYLKYAAAVALFIGLSYIIKNHYDQPKTQVYSQNLILPGKQKAILVTSSNQKIVLDSSGKKQIMKSDLVDIENTGSTLSYSKNELVSRTEAVPEYNTLITPRGGEYTLVLSDGTEVMLNSDSKLKYPVVFDNNVREVTLEGEAFFKVKKSDKIPFVVKTNNINVTVYGTVFNVSAYNNESFVQTTLVEGSVGVNIRSSKSSQETRIKPRQQLTYYKSSDNIETKEVNTSQFIAWTKGMFVFENEPIENILKVLSRWYDFDIEFENENIKIQRFTLSIGRYDNVSKILDMISSSSNLKFSTTGNRIKIYLK